MTKTDATILTAVGRRKTASARVRLTPSEKTTFMVNGMDARAYLNTNERSIVIGQPFLVEGVAQAFTIEAKVAGGGKSAQAEAIRHAISRALIKSDITLRTPLKREGYLKRDPRSKERKKPGLKKARKRPQWSKR